MDRGNLDRTLGTVTEIVEFGPNLGAVGRTKAAWIRQSDLDFGNLDRVRATRTGLEKPGPNNIR